MNTYQLWDFENYLAETNDQNEIQAVYTNEPQQYGNLISQYRIDGAVWTPSYYQYDSLGSTRALTDDAEEATDTYVYDAWGMKWRLVDRPSIRSGGSDESDTIGMRERGRSTFGHGCMSR